MAGPVAANPAAMAGATSAGVVGRDTITFNGQQIPATPGGVKQGILTVLK